VVEQPAGARVAVACTPTAAGASTSATGSARFSGQFVDTTAVSEHLPHIAAVGDRQRGAGTGREARGQFLAFPPVPACAHVIEIQGGSETHGILEISFLFAFGWGKHDAPAGAGQAVLDPVVAQLVLYNLNVGNRSAGLDHEAENNLARQVPTCVSGAIKALSHGGYMGRHRPFHRALVKHADGHLQVHRLVVASHRCMGRSHVLGARRVR
jgi:hypothetical protein